MMAGQDDERPIYLVVSADEENVAQLAQTAGDVELRLAPNIELGWRLFTPLTLQGVAIDMWLPDGCGAELYAWMLYRAPWVPLSFMLSPDDEIPEYLKRVGEGFQFEDAALEEIIKRIPPFDYSIHVASVADIAKSIGCSVEEAEAEMDELARKMGVETHAEAIAQAMYRIEESHRQAYLKGEMPGQGGPPDGVLH